MREVGWEGGWKRRRRKEKAEEEVHAGSALHLSALCNQAASPNKPYRTGNKAQQGESPGRGGGLTVKRRPREKKRKKKRKLKKVHLLAQPAGTGALLQLHPSTLLYPKSLHLTTQFSHSLPPPPLHQLALSRKINDVQVRAAAWCQS